MVSAGVVGVLYETASPVEGGRVWVDPEWRPGGAAEAGNFTPRPGQVTRAHAILCFGQPANGVDHWEIGQPRTSRRERHRCSHSAWPIGPRSEIGCGTCLTGLVSAGAALCGIGGLAPARRQ